jgi:hypothetical protein
MSRNMEASYEEVCRALSETPVPDLEEVSAINFVAFSNYTGNLCLVSRGGQANFFFKSANRKSANSWAHSTFANPQIS